MPKRQKCPTCSKGWCKNHLFEISPCKKDLYYKKIQKIRLCPKLHKPSNKYQKSIPLFNKDQKFYTPSFIMEQEQKFYEENDQRMKQNHMQKLNTIKSGESQMVHQIFKLLLKFVFFPLKIDHVVYSETWKKEKLLFCLSSRILGLSGCKNRYSQHVESDQHKNKLKENRFNRYILQLEDIVKKSKPKILEQIQKKAQTNQVDETADVLVLQQNEKIQKKVIDQQIIIDKVLEALLE